MMTRQASLFALALAISAPAASVVAPANAPPMATSIAAADTFFSDPRLAETRAVIVMQDGKRIYERYAPGYNPGNRFVSWSMAKSLTSTIIGLLVADGKLDLDAPAPVPEWRKTPGDPRAAITLRQLLHMTSGLRHSEAEPVESADTNRALFGDKSGDIIAHAVSAPLAHPPGSTFQYSSLTSHILADVAVRTIAPEAETPAERRAAMRNFLNQRLIGPAGMASLLCEYDPKGTLLGGSLCHATARDWANFGQLYLDGGRVAGRQVVSPDWVSFVTAPSPKHLGYGGHFWLNRPRPGTNETSLFADQGPPDAFAAIGHLGQYVISVPSKNLVVVRLGMTPDSVRKPVQVALGKLVNSFPDAAR